MRMVVDDLRPCVERPKVAGLCLSRPIEFVSVTADGPTIQSDLQAVTSFF